MITKKQWKSVVEKIADLRSEGKDIYYKDWQKINRVCWCVQERHNNKGSGLFMGDNTWLTHKSFRSLKDVSRYIHWIEIHHLEF